MNRRQRPALFFGAALSASLVVTACADGPARGHRPAADVGAPTELRPEALAAVRGAFEAYEQARALLAADSLQGVDEAATRIAAELEKARAAAGDGRVDDAAKAARALAAATEIEAARKDFGEVGRALIALASADARLKEGWHVFECPMAKGFNKWLQRPSELENPYMGQKMLRCGSASEWSVEAQETLAASDGHTHDDDEIAYYTCPMHPSVKQAGPGQCPICAMDLTPVTKRELASGTLFVDDVRRQKIGVKTAPVTRRKESRTVRALGKVAFDETRVVDVTLRISGFVEELLVDETGQPVKKGQTLFTLYSPELYAAQVEYLQAVKLADKSGLEGLGDLASAAHKRLTLWDLSEAQIELIARRDKPLDALPIASPASGYVVEKHVNQGSKVAEGALAYRIAALDKVWIEVEIYESDLAQLDVGQEAIVTLPYDAGKELRGKVSFIQPMVDDKSRVGRARIELANEGLALKPNMYANVAIALGEVEGLWVPASAVIYTGKRRLVFVDLGEGRLKPQELELGQKSEGYFPVLAGLREGDVVVTSGNFLIAAESRLKSATEYWASGEGEEAP